MMTRYAFLAVILCGFQAAVNAAEQPQAPAPDQQVPSVSAPVVVQPAGETVQADRDPALVNKLRELRKQLRVESRKKRASTPEEARAFRNKAVTLAIEYHNMLGKKAPIPLLDNEKLEIHKLIYAHPRIAAGIFADELEIYRSTEAYDYKAQAESVYGDREKAEADWTAAIKLAPGAELLSHRGQMFLRQHKYDRAIEDFTSAIKAGGLAPAYHSRASAYFYKDDYAGAAEDLEQFFKVNTDKEFSDSVARSRLCSGLRRHGFEVPGCAAPAAEGEKK